MDGLSARFFALVLVTAATGLVSTTSALAASSSYAASSTSEDGDMQGYDSIVNQLNRETDRSNVTRAKATAAVGPDAFDSIWFHGGVGLASYMESLTFDDGSSLFIGQKGIAVSGGIDLFSSNWIAEATMRNFGETEDNPTHISLKDFDLKVVFHDTFSRRMGFHVGGGLSARYMTIRRAGQATQEYTTPTSVIAGGMEYFFADRLSVGIEGAARNAMISETVDRASYDATIRVDLQL